MQAKSSAPLPEGGLKGIEPIQRHCSLRRRPPVAVRRCKRAPQRCHAYELPPGSSGPHRSHGRVVGGAGGSQGTLCGRSRRASGGRGRSLRRRLVLFTLEDLAGRPHQALLTRLCALLKPLKGGNKEVEPSHNENRTETIYIHSV